MHKSADVKQASGLLRLFAISAVLVGAGVTFPYWQVPAKAVLRWFDHLAPKPGLSGLALLALAPVLFLIVVAIGRWVSAGFARQNGRGTPDA